MKSTGVVQFNKAIVFILGITAILIFAQCTNLKPLSIEKEKYLDYQPIEPIPQKEVEFYQTEENRFTRVPWASLSDSTKKKPAAQSVGPGCHEENKGFCDSFES